MEMYVFLDDQLYRVKCDMLFWEVDPNSEEFGEKEATKIWATSLHCVFIRPKSVDIYTHFMSTNKEVDFIFFFWTSVGKTDRFY